VTSNNKIFRVGVGDLGTNCWIIPGAPAAVPGGTPLGDGECIVVDPGGDGEKILARLSELDLHPRYIVLTHAHLDHIAALPDLAAAWPKADVAVHPAEAAKLGPHSLEIHRQDFQRVGVADFADALWQPMPEASLLLNEGDTLGPFVVLHLPGHSPGSIALHWEAEQILLSGDTLFNAGVGRTDLYGGETELLNQSLARLFTLDETITVCPGHGPKTTIGREKYRYG